MQPTIGLTSFTNAHPALTAALNTTLIRSVASLIKTDHYDQTKLTKLFNEQVFASFNINLKEKLRNEVRSFVDLAYLHHLYNNPDFSQVCKITHNPEILQAFQKAMRDQFEHTTNIAFALEQIPAENILPAISSVSVPMDKTPAPAAAPTLSKNEFEICLIKNFESIANKITTTDKLVSLVNKMQVIDPARSAFIHILRGKSEVAANDFLICIKAYGLGNEFLRVLARIPQLSDCLKLFEVKPPEVTNINTNAPVIATPKNSIEPLVVAEISYEAFIEICHKNWDFLKKTIQSTDLLETIMKNMSYYDGMNYSKFLAENRTSGEIGIINFLTYVIQTNKGNELMSAMAKIPELHDCARLFGAYTQKASTQPILPPREDVPMKELPPESPEDIQHALYCDIMKTQRASIIEKLKLGNFIPNIIELMPAIQSDEEFYFTLLGVSSDVAANQILDWVVKKKCWNDFFVVLSELHLQNVVKFFTFE